MNTKLRIGDQVIITAGKDKGRKGKIEKIFPKTGRVVVPGLNVYKRHKKGFGGQKGGIIEISRPYFPASVALICPKCEKPTRVGFRIDDNKDKIRFCKKCQVAIQISEGKKHEA